MRDQNRIRAYIPYPAKPCFQPTYEGLELVIFVDFASCLYSFQPTYEGLELKQQILIKLEHFYCFQPTYEGLEPGLSLPKKARITKSFQPTYEGLEHSAERKADEREYLVFSLPMRDQNGKTPRVKDIPKGSFQPTYEGLEHKKQVAWNVVRLLFSAYL